MATDTMLALYLDRAEGTASATLEQVPLPAPGPGEVRVALKAAALNHREIWIAKGRYPHLQLPTTMGADGAGVVEAVGDGIDPAMIGSEVILYPGLDWGDDPAIPAANFGVLGMPGPGTVAEAICVRADRVTPKPASLSFTDAAAWPLAGLTAWRALFTKAAYKAGQSVLITGAGGGVAACALLIAVAAGARVFVTSSKQDTIDDACAHGALAGVNYTEDGWGTKLRALSGGIDVVIDSAPAQGYPNYAQALNRGARIVIYGAGAAPTFEVKAAELFLNNFVVLGTNMGNLDEFQDLVRFIERHSLRAPVERVFPLAEAREALVHLETAHGRGKVVIQIVPE